MRDWCDKCNDYIRGDLVIPCPCSEYKIWPEDDPDDFGYARGVGPEKALKNHLNHIYCGEWNMNETRFFYVEAPLPLKYEQITRFSICPERVFTLNMERER